MAEVRLCRSAVSQGVVNSQADAFHVIQLSFYFYPLSFMTSASLWRTEDSCVIATCRGVSLRGMEELLAVFGA